MVNVKNILSLVVKNIINKEKKTSKLTENFMLH